MKQKAMANTLCSLILLSLCLLPAAVFSGQEEAAPQETAAPEAAVHPPVPAEKAQLWKDLQNVARKNYEVCLEHCGNDQDCFNRCEKAYNARLMREYRMLLEKKEAAPEK